MAPLKPARYGDKLPPKPRQGMMVGSAHGTDGKQAPIGVWPEHFAQRYSLHENMFVRMGAQRKNFLQHLQRLNGVNEETITARRAGRPANLPNVDVRAQLLKKAEEELQKIAQLRFDAQEQFRTMADGLKPFDYSNSTLHEINLRNLRLANLASAKDDKARLALLKSAAFR